MKKINKIVWGLLVTMVVAVGCNDMLEIDTDNFASPDNYSIKAPADTTAALTGIFTQVSKLADRFVLLGELRGDLMTITENADSQLREIYNFNVSPNNQFNNVADYYTVINLCNYVINHTDTSLVVETQKAFYKYMAAAKSIRAWTYMQIALNYGKAKYYTEPILTVQQGQKNYPEYGIKELAQVLITDLKPFANIAHPGYVSLENFVYSNYLIIPVKLMLADLYLWAEQYEDAALAYRDVIIDNKHFSYYRSTYNVQNNVFVSAGNGWNGVNYYNAYEQIALLASTPQSNGGLLLSRLALTDYQIAPSEAAVNNWAQQTYYHSATVFTSGDLRGAMGSYITPEASFDSLKTITSGNVINKYFNMNLRDKVKTVSIYRIGMLYLRYAEALNRAGKPNMAFAILKYGLNKENMTNPEIIPAWELNNRPEYMNVDVFDPSIPTYANINRSGIHSRGCGNMHLAANFKIPSLANLADSMTFVEDKIIEELALEMAFEGHRFHDLMRVALRRQDPGYLANKVGNRGKNLNIPENWYLPIK